MLAILAAVTATRASAQDPGFFGPAEGLEFQPEVDVFLHVAIGLEVTPRYYLPFSLLLSNRNRLQVNRNLGESDSVTFLYRGRLQVQREFDLGGVGLTPFGNVELVWQAPPAMWNQFRMEAGIQTSVHWFSDGQIIEVNHSTVTYLQPGRSWRPVLGLTWYQFF